ncbi:tryptophan--tRNA ligase [bacterium]|nr:tryptophan--tRNA ligase [bacterium]
MKKGRIFSGIQPTGHMHLGNYLGAIRHWADMQHDYEAIHGIMDLHAITVPQNPDDLRAATYETCAAIMAAGVDPAKAIIVAQSTVTAHSELAWILGCHTPLGWLNRMTQFKDKAGKDKEKAGLGLYGYPVLMAADILTYHGTHVPVGEDQKQHLELARDIAGAFNRACNQEFFPLPEPVIQGEATRVMSLRDGKKKMSKSDPSDYSRINLTDTADEIAQKFKKATSDSHPTITYDEENRPEVANLITIYAALSGKTSEQVVAEFDGQGFANFKKSLADLAVEKLSPITQRMRDYMADKSYLDSVLKSGAEKADAIAQPILRKTKELTGFWVK